MRLFVFDTETTSLTPGQICQLCYVMSDGETVVGKNFFFAVDWMDAGSQEIHGLSLDELEALSGGKVFADFADEIAADVASCDMLVGHNLDFDVNFLREELRRVGKKLQFRKGLCTMNYFTPLMAMRRKVVTGRPKPPKLSELAEFFGISPDDIARESEAIFGGGAQAHDARYDVVCTYKALLAGIEAGHVRNIF